MSSDNVTIKFQGFKMNEWTKKYVRSLFSEMADQSPRTAKINVTLTKKDNLIKGMIHIHSSDGSFFSSAVDQNIKTVSEKILFQVRKRLERWKSKHHEHKSIKNLELKNNNNKENYYETINNELLTA